MRVVVHPADQGGCGTYRLINVGLELARRGEDVCLSFDYKYQAYWQDTAFGSTIIGLAQDVDADVVVLQRPLHRHRVELMRALQAHGVAVVVEIDDDFHSIHRRNVAWRSSNPLTDPDHNRDWLARACRDADLVTVSTPALAERYGQHGRCVILPNYVPAWYCDVYAEPDTMIGWTGSLMTHPDDLNATGGATMPAPFHVVGTGKGVADALGLAAEPTSTGWLPLDEYPQAMAEIAVGIVPLAGHAFNEAKSWLKGLEFAALGVPFVATPTAEYRALRERYGLGHLASNRVEWETQLARLVADPGDEGERGRAVVREHLTVERNAHRWMDAWVMALEHRRGRGVTVATLDELGKDPPCESSADWNGDGVVVLPAFFAGSKLLDRYTEEWKREHGYRGIDNGILLADEPKGWPDACPYMDHEALRAICCDGVLAEVLRELTGDDMAVNLNLTTWLSTERDWHADSYLNEPEVGDYYAAVWIALDDIDPDSGVFQYVPGSHRWPQITRPTIERFFDIEDPAWPKHSERLLTPLFTDEIRKRWAPVVSYVPERGDVLVWHGRLLHRGSKPTVQGMARPALIAHYSGVHHRPAMPKAWRHIGGGFYFPNETPPPV